MSLSLGWFFLLSASQLATTPEFEDSDKNSDKELLLLFFAKKAKNEILRKETALKKKELNFIHVLFSKNKKLLSKFLFLILVCCSEHWKKL